MDLTIRTYSQIFASKLLDCPISGVDMVTLLTSVIATSNTPEFNMLKTRKQLRTYYH